MVPSIFRAPLAACAALLLLAAPARAQTYGEVSGRITEAGTDAPIPGATVLIRGTNYGTAANSEGRYRLRPPEGTYALTFSAVGFAPQTDTLRLLRGQPLTHDVALIVATEELGNVDVRAQREVEAGVFTISPEAARAIPDPMGGSDAIRSVKILPGVTSNNELSNAYSVRGGGYNENLFFLDGFEVYRPFRTRQGEQEGLGLINADLASELTLYAGGFPARYGGKLASALDVAYVRPTGPPAGSAYASGVDAGATLRAGLFRDRLGVAVAVRRATAGRLFSTQELEGVYDPEFQDVQGLAELRMAEGHTLRAVGLLAWHRFRFQPQQRRTTFGVFPDRVRTVAFRFVGQETDGYDVGFLGLRLANRLGGRLRAEHEAALFETVEAESLDVAGGITLFRVRDPNQRPDDPLNLLRTGAARQRDVADNEIRVRTLTGGGRYRLLAGRHAAEAGWQARRLEFRDRLLEFTRIAGSDSLGCPTTVTADSLNDQADISTYQAAGWLEDAVDVLRRPGRLLLTGGLRADYFALTDEWTLSPRLSARLGLSDVTTLTAAAGVYYQAPTYRELRGEPRPGETAIPAVNDSLRSQRAALFLVGAEHFLRGTRFVLRGEAWYKALDHLISYEVEGTRVLYSGVNDSRGHAYGLDLQLRGEFVPGLESWLNYGFLVAREEFVEPFVNERNTGVRPRPTDRRHNLALFVQDHIPGDSTWTLHLRALFGTGTPFTPPSVENSVDGTVIFEPGSRSTGRYPSYFRFDLGATKAALLGTVSGRPIRLGLTAEVLNVFDQKNTIAYAWVNSGEGFFEGVPTRLTPRTVNVRLRVDF